MRIHFDADLLIYRAGFAAEKSVYYVPHGDGFTRCESKKEAVAHCESDGIDPKTIESERVLEPVENALYNCKSMVKRTMEALQTDDIILYLSGPTNFREGIATIRPYKGNRDPEHKPSHGPAIKEYLHKKYDVVVSEDEEADDVVSYSHYRMWLEDEHSTVIASTDKDLDMVPGLHYNFIKEESYYVTPEEGMKWFYTQLLMGDATDNIPGIPKVGKVKAARFLEDAHTEAECYAVAKSLYEAAYPDNPAVALVENAQLLWMRLEPNQWWRAPEES